MTLTLDLNTQQQLQIKPLLLGKILENKATNIKRKAAKERKKSNFRGGICNEN